MDQEQIDNCDLIKECIEINEDHYCHVDNDLLYESGTKVKSGDNAEDTNSENSGEANHLMYLRKDVNQIVNPVIGNGYGCEVSAKKPEYEPLVEPLNKMLDDITDSDDAQDASVVAYRTCTISGLGFWTINTDYIDEVSLNQKVEIKKQSKPTQIFLGRHTKVDGSDADQGFIRTWIDKKLAKKLYGDEAKVANWENSMYSGMKEPKGKDGKLIPEVVIYKKKFNNVKRFFLNDGSYLDVQKENEIPMLQPGQVVVQIRTIRKTSVSVTKYVGDYKAYSTTLNIPYIPIIKVSGDTTYIDDDLNEETRGVVYLGRFANEVANNYSKQELVLADTAPIPPFLVDLDSMPDGQNKKAWGDFHRIPRNFLGYLGRFMGKSGAEIPTNMPVRNDNKPQSEPYMLGREKAQDDIRQTIGLPQVSHGEDPAQQSGRSVFLRQRRADIALIHNQKNFERSLKHSCKVVIDILGQVSLEPVEIKIKDPQTGEESIIKKSFAEIGITSDMFDVTLTNGPQHESKKTEAMNVLMEISTNQALLPVAHLLIDGMGLPNEEAIIEQFKRMLPPDLRDDPDGEVDPQARQMLMQYEQKIEEYKQLDEQKTQMYDRALQYIQQLQMALESKKDEIEGKLVQEQIKGDYALKKQEMSDNADIQQEVIKANADQTQEETKQTGETIRNAQDIQAEATRDTKNLMGQVVGSIANSQPETQEFPNPEGVQFRSVVRGPVSLPNMEKGENGDN